MEVARLAVYDVELRSLGRANAQRLAKLLVELKLAPSAEIALSAMVRPPSILARYVAYEAAEAARTALKASGVELALQISRAYCLYCDHSMVCDKGTPYLGGGVTFSCWACGGLSLVDPRERKFRPMLRCGACNSLLALPVESAFGDYPCKCGKTLTYARILDSWKETKKQPPPWVQLRKIAPYLGVYFLLVGLIVLALLPGRDPRREGAEPAVSSASTLGVARAYGRFDSSTDRAAVVAALGQPQAEVASEDGEEQVLFYRNYDLYVVLEKTDTTFSYVRTVRISDEVILHEVSEF